MVFRLDPRHPLVWRTPSSVQLGVDPPIARLDDVTETQERLLAALAVGVSRPGLVMIARGRGDELDALLQSVSPALLDGPVDAVKSVAISGTGRLTDTLIRGLAGSGVHTASAADAGELAGSRPDLAILLDHYVTPPVLHGLWLRRDVPHLPVVVSDGGASVGPIVEPGAGPCLLCLELHRKAADPAWPAIATQLLGRRAAEPPVLALEAAATATRMVLERLDAGPGPAVSVRIDAATGARATTTWQPHPDCGCRGIEQLLDPALAARAGR